ncbi:hypothetical protein BAQ48_07835 [Bacillus luti]|uniref:hypothetical protein n=1 Tax=Bacillus luti TaxID=2026191 RepID=UPI0008FE2B7F|nr:hypothetical protein [Bacillus luti]OJE52737.1 hypothetical protein BAQ48_07835 [Bacillus luti]
MSNVIDEIMNQLEIALFEVNKINVNQQQLFNMYRQIQFRTFNVSHFTEEEKEEIEDMFMEEMDDFRMHMVEVLNRFKGLHIKLVKDENNDFNLLESLEIIDTISENLASEFSVELDDILDDYELQFELKGDEESKEMAAVVLDLKDKIEDLSEKMINLTAFTEVFLELDFEVA